MKIYKKGKIKMSSISGLSDMLTNLESSIESLKNELENNISSAIKLIVQTSGNEFEVVYTNLRSFTTSQSKTIEKDFDDIEKLFKDVADNIERVSERAFHTFVNKTEDELAKIETTTTNALNSIRSASNFIRTEIASGIRASITDAKNEFNSIKDSFTTEVKKVSDDIINKTRSVVTEVKNGTITDIEKLNKFRERIDEDIENKFRDVESVLSKAKNQAEKELDGITKLVIEETKKLESKVSSLKSDIRAVSIYIAIASLIAGAAAALTIVALKERQYTAKLEKKK